ncbi:hypothetical protein PMPD1_0675 [Paramixta manurensis]|uniref:Flagellar protein FliT n=1 Tax=Paramixta manurensis TaxID=2740817 RepID=A0A6M8UB49_9GAMM|nr:hypothetical protein PMPD1_0675 [Erwiniaceae bacterium PD-1]
MDDMALIHALAGQLTRAAQENDWNQLRKVDRAVAQLLSALTLSEVTAEKRAALDQLRQVHQSVYAVCKQRSEALKQKMQQHQRQRSGLQAYALFSLQEDV